MASTAGSTENTINKINLQLLAFFPVGSWFCLTRSNSENISHELSVCWWRNMETSGAQMWRFSTELLDHIKRKKARGYRLYIQQMEEGGGLKWVHQGCIDAGWVGGVIKWSILQLLRPSFLGGDSSFPTQHDMIDCKAMTRTPGKQSCLCDDWHVSHGPNTYSFCPNTHTHTHTYTHTTTHTHQHPHNKCFVCMIHEIILKKAAVIARIDLRVPESKKIQKS